MLGCTRLMQPRAEPGKPDHPIFLLSGLTLLYLPLSLRLEQANSRAD